MNQRTESPIDRSYLLDTLAKLLAIPSPSGMTDEIVVAVSAELDALGVPYGLTRRGATRADLEGGRHSPDRAIVAYLDTLGAIVMPECAPLTSHRTSAPTLSES